MHAYAYTLALSPPHPFMHKPWQSAPPHSPSDLPPFMQQPRQPAPLCLCVMTHCLIPCCRVCCAGLVPRAKRVRQEVSLIACSQRQQPLAAKAMEARDFLCIWVQAFICEGGGVNKACVACSVSVCANNAHAHVCERVCALWVLEWACTMRLCSKSNSNWACGVFREGMHTCGLCTACS